MEASLKKEVVRGYFNSAQALQDYAELILHLKQKLNASKSPVIVFGASYGGMLAAWFRLKYPHIAIGALASSAPVLYFDNIVPQDCFYSVITKDYRETSENCYNIIRGSWGEIDKIAAQPGGFSILTKRLNLCSPLVNVSKLKEFLQILFTETAQYNPWKSNQDYVKDLCDAIERGAKNASDDLLDGIYAGIVATFKGERCQKLNETISRVTKETVLGWDWQACSEMVTPIGQTLKDSMFPIEPFNLTTFANTCKQRYNVAPRPHWITSYFGGYDIKSVLERFGSNIIFFNGLKDPYSCGGVLKNISDTLVALNHKNGSHCQDVSRQEGDDPQWLIDIRKKERDIIRNWIDEYYATVNNS